MGNCNVEYIIVSEDNETYSTQDGVLFNKDKTKLYRFPERSPLTEYEIPDFEFCCNLKSVAIPNSVTIIKENAFFGCSGLGSIVIPDNVIEIEERAFLYSGLNEVMVSKNTIIGKKAFENNLFDEPKINYY